MPIKELRNLSLAFLLLLGIPKAQAENISEISSIHLLQTSNFSVNFKQISEPSSSILFIPQQLEAKTNAPQQRRDPGSTGKTACNSRNNTKLTALVPSRMTDGSWQAIITQNERTRLWFYIPFEDASLDAELFLAQEGSEDGRTISLTLENGPKIIGVDLGTLQEGIRYDWIFTVICDPESPELNKTVFGQIRRIPVAETHGTVEICADKAVDYAANGFWNEALTILFNELYFSNENQVRLMIGDLFHQVGLERSIANDTSLQVEQR